MDNSELWKEPLSVIEHALARCGEEACRLFHGRGGVFPEWKHVAVDWYAPAVFVTFYEHREQSDGFLQALSLVCQNNPAVKALAVQRRYIEKSPVEVMWGTLPDRAHEGGLKFLLSLEKNQNHGFFLDMRPGRDWVRAHAEGKRVLNLFAYTCAISVAAVAGGSLEVVNLDQSSGALGMGRENHRLNFDVSTCRKVRYLAHDLFKSWGRLKRLAPFDLVVLDPPSHQPGSFVAAKDYSRMLRRLPEVLNPAGALILVCLNAPELDVQFIESLMAEYLPKAQFVEKLPDPLGYVESDPSKGLKRLVYQI